MTGAVHFEVYRAPGIILTSLLRGGGDWRWRFCDTQGKVLARGEGYRSREECLEVVGLLQRRASVANVIDLSPAAAAKPARR